MDSLYGSEACMLKETQQRILSHLEFMAKQATALSEVLI